MNAAMNTIVYTEISTYTFAHSCVYLLSVTHFSNVLTLTQIGKYSYTTHQSHWQIVMSDSPFLTSALFKSKKKNVSTHTS